MPTHVTKIISGNAYKNNGATVFGAGNATTTGADPNVTKNLTLIANSYRTQYGSHPVLAVSPTSSGTLCTTKINSSRAFGQMEEGQYVVRLLNSKIGGVASTLLRSGASDFGVRRPIPRMESCRALGVNTWNYATGAITKGGTAGDSVSFSTDKAARPTYAIPGSFVFFTGKVVPTATNYAAKTST